MEIITLWINWLKISMAEIIPDLDCLAMSSLAGGLKFSVLF